MIRLILVGTLLLLSLSFFLQNQEQEVTLRYLFGLRSASTPICDPKTASTNPTDVNPTTNPPASARGAKRCFCAADPRTTGTSGNTQGDKIVRAPAPYPSKGLRISEATRMTHEDRSRQRTGLWLSSSGRLRSHWENR